MVPMAIGHPQQRRVVLRGIHVIFSPEFLSRRRRFAPTLRHRYTAADWRLDSAAALASNSARFSNTRR